MNQNLEVLIEEHSHVMAEQMLSTAAWAGSEEDVRIQCTKLIDEFITKAGLSIQGRHEYGLAGGRIDSKYGGVVIEYKYPKGASAISGSADSAGVKAVAKQIKTRFKDLHEAENVAPDRIFGVGCDGSALIFVRQRGSKLAIEPPQPVTPHTVQRILRALVSLGAKGLSFTPENLEASFGSESASAQEGVRLIHDVIHTTTNPKARTFFDQWKILFGEVCGYDITGTNTRVEKLASHFGIAGPDPAELLFSVHTYYALFIKLLAAEITSSFSPLGVSPLQKVVSAPTSEKLRDELRELEQGGIWSHLGIRNFLEGDLFSWYVDAWDGSLEAATRSMSLALADFDPTTLSVDPFESRDLLKQLYQQLFPKSIRHDLGEYYTPDWLAELVLDEVGYDGDPDKRLLDPACGSGTFLVMAINRVKAWYAEHRYECGYSETELVGKLLENIVGFDLNPLAVMAARTNYLLAIRDLLRHTGDIELRVYLCDSIMTPSEYGDLFTGGHGTARLLKTSAGDFTIPNEIAESREQIGKYADTLEFCVRNSYSPNEFLKRCVAEGIPIAEAPLHIELYKQLVALDVESKNGVWARIIKNAFAPLFVGEVDYIVGNPPWVNWQNLPEGYRDGMKPLWQRYGLFSLSGSAGRLGGGKKDISTLFVYCAVDNYLRDRGRLGFVITQSVLKTKDAGDGFRRFQFEREGQTYYINPLRVHDLSEIQVFEGATNRTAALICEKRTRSFDYPVAYTAWRGPSRLPQDLSLEEAHRDTHRAQLAAIPVDPSKRTSPWLTAPEQALPGIRKVLGRSQYRAYTGVYTGGLNGCFWIRVLETRTNGELLIENLHDVGRIKVPHVETVIEPDLVYPLLRGRDVRRWSAEPSCSLILAQDPQTKKGIPESVMKDKYPKTYEFLRTFEGDPANPTRGTLRGRALYRSYYKPTDPFYSMYNVGPYTVADWKVQWQHTGVQDSMRAAVTPWDKLGDQKVILVACESPEEAHYLCALINSTPVFSVIKHYISLDASPHVLEHVAIPLFESGSEVHKRLADLSLRCHSAVGSSAADQVCAIESEINELAASIWGITRSELDAIHAAMPA